MNPDDQGIPLTEPLPRPGHGTGPLVMRRCLMCGKEFPARMAQHLYCSRACSRSSEGTKRKRHEAEQERRHTTRGRECRVCLIRDDEAGVWSSSTTLCAACDRRLQRRPACLTCGWSGARCPGPGGVCPRCYPEGLLLIELHAPPQDGRVRHVYRALPLSLSGLVFHDAPPTVSATATPDQWRTIR